MEELSSFASQVIFLTARFPLELRPPILFEEPAVDTFLDLQMYGVDDGRVAVERKIQGRFQFSRQRKNQTEA